MTPCMFNESAFSFHRLNQLVRSFHRLNQLVRSLPWGMIQPPSISKMDLSRGGYRGNYDVSITHEDLRTVGRSDDVCEALAYAIIELHDRLTAPTIVDPTFPHIHTNKKEWVERVRHLLGHYGEKMDKSLQCGHVFGSAACSLQPGHEGDHLYLAPVVGARFNSVEELVRGIPTPALQIQKELALPDPRLLDAITTYFPACLPVGSVIDPVDVVVGILKDAAALIVRSGAEATYRQEAARYHKAAKQYGAAMKTRQFRVVMQPPVARDVPVPALAAWPGPRSDTATVYEFGVADRGPQYVAVLRADSTVEAGRNLGAWQQSLPPNCKLIVIPAGCELDVAELVAVDPLPYDAVRRFPGIVETDTCGRCGLTADINWAGWWSRGNPEDPICAHCYAKERPDEYVRMKDDADLKHGTCRHCGAATNSRGSVYKLDVCAACRNDKGLR